MNNWGGDKIVR